MTASVEMPARRSFRAAIALIALVCPTYAQSSLDPTSTAASQYAGNYYFARPALDTLHRLYRVNTRTGEMGACVYFKPEGEDGYTKCFGSTGTAGAKVESAPYRLMLAGHKDAEGVFRINLETGDMIYCFFKEDASVKEGAIVICPKSSS